MRHTKTERIGKHSWDSFLFRSAAFCSPVGSHWASMGSARGVVFCLTFVDAANPPTLARTALNPYAFLRMPRIHRHGQVVSDLLIHIPEEMNGVAACLYCIGFVWASRSCCVLLVPLAEGPENEKPPETLGRKSSPSHTAFRELGQPKHAPAHATAPCSSSPHIPRSASGHTCYSSWHSRLCSWRKPEKPNVTSREQTLQLPCPYCLLFFMMMLILIIVTIIHIIIIIITIII